MAPPRAKISPSKKHILTLAQIASYDDILTDTLVDHAFYWTTIPKNRPSYLPSRGVKEEEVTKIIQNHLILEPDLQLAEEKLLATNGLGKFYRALKTDPEKEDFRRHLRRYMQIYLPDSPFEVTATNRYTIFQEEASISARRFIKSHETIKYLSGIQVVITPKEEAELSERKKDFSIVISSRKKEANLFMGPARFANHDCDANARLVTTGQAGIEIIATKPISVGEEITVTYGDSYFGEDNCECLCKTCEDNLVNGWAPAAGTVPAIKQSVEGGSGRQMPLQGYALRRREEHTFNRGHSETPSFLPTVRPKVSRASLRKLVRAAGTTPATEDELSGSLLKHRSELGRGQKRNRNSLLATPPITPAKRHKTRPEIHPQKVNASREGSSSFEDDISCTAIETSHNSNLSLFLDTAGQMSEVAIKHGMEDAQIDGNTTMNDAMPSPESTQKMAELDGCNSEINESIVVASAGETMVVTEPPTTTLKVEEALVAGLDVLALPTPAESLDSGEDEKMDDCAPTSTAPSDGLPGDDLVVTAARTPQRGRPRKSSLKDGTSKRNSPATARKAGANKDDQQEGEQFEDEDDEDGKASGTTRHRVPGDYTLTPLLLAEPETAWIVCSVCSKAFVQRDAYFTRMSCPRCERHSKLYGYVWPKTEPEGKWDKEERILDHRLVHRFLHAGEEAKIRGRKQASWHDGSTMTDDSNSRQRTSKEQTDAKPSLGSGIWRKMRYTIAKEKAEQASKLSRSRPVKANAKAGKTTSTDQSLKAGKADEASVSVAKVPKATTTVNPAGRPTKAVTAGSPKPSDARRTTARLVKTDMTPHERRLSGRPRRASARTTAE